MAVRVALGDTLWAYDGPRWVALKKDNPWLEADKRIAGAMDSVLVLIYEGEFVCGATVQDVRSGEPKDINPSGATPAAEGRVAPAPTPVDDSGGGREPLWLLLLAVIGIAALIGALVYLFRL